MKNLNESSTSDSRRSFLKGTAATAATLAVGGSLLPDLASAAEAKLASPGQNPYITTLTPEIIADNNKGWQYYGGESGELWAPTPSTPNPR